MHLECAGVCWTMLCCVSWRASQQMEFGVCSLQQLPYSSICISLLHLHQMMHWLLCQPNNVVHCVLLCFLSLFCCSASHSGEAMGLSFSVPPGMRVPPSLANMYKELAADLGCKTPNHGCLEKVKTDIQGHVMLCYMCYKFDSS
jgi:hypothetical protein